MVNNDKDNLFSLFLILDLLSKAYTLNFSILLKNWNMAFIQQVSPTFCKPTKPSCGKLKGHSKCLIFLLFPIALLILE